MVGKIWLSPFLGRRRKMNKTNTLAAILVAGDILAFLWPSGDNLNVPENVVFDPENSVLIATGNVCG